MFTVDEEEQTTEHTLTDDSAVNGADTDTDSETVSPRIPVGAIRNTQRNVNSRFASKRLKINTNSTGTKKQKLGAKSATPGGKASATSTHFTRPRNSRTVGLYKEESDIDIDEMSSDSSEAVYRVRNKWNKGKRRR